MTNTSLALLSQIKQSQLLPVVLLDRVDNALPLAHALLEGGIQVIEITLRTGAALAAIELIARDIPDIVVGVGTLIEEKQIHSVQNAGAQFAVTPGFAPQLIEKVITANLPIIPGVATAGEVMQARMLGLSTLKLFPAESIGGRALLKSLHSPFADITFIPTGGIDAQLAKSYYALANVVAIGGSWMVAHELLNAQNFIEITRLVKQAKTLLNAIPKT